MTKKKSARELDADIASALANPSRPLLPIDWPKRGKWIVEEAARQYRHEIGEPFAVPDVHLDEALEYIDRELERYDREGEFDDAKESWYARFEKADGLHPEIRSAIKTWSRTITTATLKF